MNRWTNVALLVAAAGVAVAAQVMFGPPRVISGATIRAVASHDAEIISVDAPSNGSGGQQSREAVVKLANGDIVRAMVPGACVVFAGQHARVSQYGDDSAASYVVVENSK